MANVDFLVEQLRVIGPLDFLRMWIPSGGDDEYSIVAEVVREEEPDAFTVEIRRDLSPESTTALADLGFAGGQIRMEDADEELVSRTVRDALRIVVPDGHRMSLTHGTRAHTVLRRRLERLNHRLNEMMREQNPNWREERSTPIPFTSGALQLWLWPRIESNHDVVDVWALIASNLPADPAVDTYVLTRNESLYFGRIHRQKDRAYYRETLYAGDLANATLHFAVAAAVATTRAIGPDLATLGAVDATVPPPPSTGVDQAEPPPAPEPSTGMYL
jgi:hypothetical protein